MIDTLSIATQGFYSAAHTDHRSLAIATQGFILLADAQPVPQPIRVGGAGGGPLPLFVPGIAAQPDDHDYKTRARTVVATMGVAMTDGDLAAKLTAALGLAISQDEEDEK
jgi:hypothetical protein